LNVICSDPEGLAVPESCFTVTVNFSEAVAPIFLTTQLIAPVVMAPLMVTLAGHSLIEESPLHWMFVSVQLYVMVCLTGLPVTGMPGFAATVQPLFPAPLVMPMTFPLAAAGTFPLAPASAIERVAAMAPASSAAAASVSTR
jgi:hypothetical protein